jgi:hypothetical protein
MKPARDDKKDPGHKVLDALFASGARLRPYAMRIRSAARALGSRWRSLFPLVKALRDGARKRLQAAGRRVKRQGGARLRLAGAAALLALGIGLAALYAGTIELYYRAATASAALVPLGNEARRAAQDKAKQLASALDRRLDKKGKFARDAWTSARILVALKEHDPAYRANPKLIERYFRSLAGPECACWRVLPHGRYPNHVGVTSWALRALAEYGIPAQPAELRFLLATQDEDGRWPLYAGATEERFASSYATAAAILALHGQSALQSDSKLKERLAAAVQRGAGWLKKHAAPGGARWADYPSWPKGGDELLGVSGFVLVALHRVGAADLDGLDRDWMRRLPGDAPAASAGEASAKTVRIGKRSYADRTRYYALPWSVLATAFAYPNASIAGKVRAIEWLERALAPGASIHALTGRERNAAVAAEALIALSGTAAARQ